MNVNYFMQQVNEMPFYVKGYQKCHFHYIVVVNVGLENADLCIGGQI